MATSFTNASSYCPASAFLERCDQRSVARWCSDTNTAIESASLAANTKLLAALQSASGMVESACLVGHRYSPTDLAGLTGNAQAHLYQIVTWIAEFLLWSRRPVLGEGEPPFQYKIAYEELERLRRGESIFGIQEAADAGHLAVEREDASTVEDRGMVTYQAERLFGRRANRYDRR